MSEQGDVPLEQFNYSWLGLSTVNSPGRLQPDSSKDITSFVLMVERTVLNQSWKRSLLSGKKYFIIGSSWSLKAAF